MLLGVHGSTASTAPTHSVTGIIMNALHIATSVASMRRSILIVLHTISARGVGGQMRATASTRAELRHASILVWALRAAAVAAAVERRHHRLCR